MHDLPIGSPRNDLDRHELTAAQTDMLIAQRAAPASTAFMTGYVFDYDLGTDPDLLHQSIAEVLAQFDGARSRFGVDTDGRPFRVLADRTPTTRTIDLRGSDDPGPEATVSEMITTGFDDASAGVADVPLLHTTLMWLPDGYRWHLNVHHAVLDAAGAILLAEAVSTVYGAGGDTGRLPRWDTDAVVDDDLTYRASSAVEADRRFWAEHMTELGPPLTLLPPIGEPTGSAHQFETTLDESVRRGLTETADAIGVRVAHVQLAAYVAYVHRWSSEPVITLSVPTACRPTPLLQTTPAMLSTVHPLTIEVDPDDTLAVLARRVRARLESARPHSRYRGEDMIRDRATAGHAPRPRFGPGANIILADRDETSALQWTGDPVDVGPFHDLELVISSIGTNAPLLLKLRGDAAAAADIDAHGETLVSFLDRLVARPHTPVADLDILSVAAREKVIRHFNDTDAIVSRTPVTEMFEAAAVAAPDATALVGGDRRIDYRTLRTRVDELARALQDSGLHAEEVVALGMPRSAEMIVGLLAILRAGGAFVPLDPGWPDDRRAKVLADAGARRILGSREWPVDLDDWAYGGCDAPARVDVSPDRLAYVIFTSGSTGRPKGAMIRHGAISERLNWQVDEILHFGADDVSLFKAPLSFDISINEILLPLVAGGRLVIAEPGGERDPRYLLDVIARESVTFVYLVSSMLDALLQLDDAGRMTGLRHVWCGGEVLSPSLFGRFRRAMDTTLYHGYGPAEATIGVSHVIYRDSADRIATSIGAPNPNTRLYVLDSNLQPVPVGCGGELYAAGALLGRGYSGAPALTAGRFVADPFAADGSRMYRTGDRARWRTDGSLDFLGRIDNQVKIRGMRLELEDVEAALSGHPDVRHAAVTVVDNNGTDALAGYAVLRDGPDRDMHPSFETWMRGLLPDYMVPPTITILDHFPLTANGKLDRRALPAPRRAAAAGQSPRNETERRLCAIFADALGIDDVGVTDDFFQLGGHSLMAFRLVVAIESAFGVDVSLNTLFTARTVARLVESVDFATRTDRIAPSDFVSSGSGPVSAGQEQLLFLTEMAGSSGDYLLVLDLDLDRSLDPDVLNRALRDVLARHPVLRTVYPRRGDSWIQQVLAPQEAIAAITPADVDRPAVPFDLAAEPPIRLGLRTERSAPALRIMLHHIACDQESVPTIVSDLAEAYTRESRTGTSSITDDAPPVDYVQFAQWQRHRLDDASRDDSEICQELDFWSRRLAAVEPVTPLPYDFPRAEVHSARGELITVELADDVSSAVRSLSSRLSTTPLMALHAAVATALHAAGAGHTVPVGTAVDGRTHHELTNVVGYFVNTVVLTSRVDVETTFEQFLAQVRRDDVAAYDHRSVPFEKVVERLAPPRPVGVNPLFQVMIAEFDDRPITAEFDGDRARSRFGAGSVAAKFDLTFGIGRTHDGTEAVSLVYDASLFSAETATRLIEAVHAVLAHGVRYPHHTVLSPVGGAHTDIATAPLSASQRRLLDAGVYPSESVSRFVPGAGPDFVYRLVSRFDAARMTLVNDADEPHWRLRASTDVIADDPLAAAPIDVTRRAVTAELADGGVLLRAHPLLIDPESWELLIGDADTGTRFADYLRSEESAGADLTIVDAAEAWLDFGDDAMLALDERPRALSHEPTGSATSTVRRTVARTPVPLDRTDTTTAVLIALARALSAGHQDFAELVDVDEPDRDRFGNAVGRLRRRYPRLITSETARLDITGADAEWRADAADPGSFGIAGHLSPHTEGVFDEFPQPPTLITVAHGGAIRPEPAPDRYRLHCDVVVTDDALELQITAPGAETSASLPGVANRWIGELVAFLPDLARPADGADLSAQLTASEADRLVELFGPVRRVWPLSPLQTGLLFHLHAADHSDVYLSQTVVTLNGPLDRERLAAAADNAAAKFPNVAVGFTELGDRTVQVLPEEIEIGWTYSHDSDPEAFAASERAKAFTADKPPLFRFGVCSDSTDDRHRLVFTAEHILLDGWSIWRFLVSVLDSYTDAAAETDRQVTPFSRYLTWLGSRDVADARAQWGDYLSGIEEPTQVAPREQSLGATSATESRNTLIDLDPALARQLMSASERTGVTLSTIFETAWSLTLRRITGTDDVSFGSVVSGRPPEIDGIDTTIGLLFNTVPTRFVLDRSRTVAQTLHDAQQRKLLHLTHPYITLSELLQLSGHRALFDTLFVFQNTPVLSPDKPYGPPDAQIYVEDVALRDATHYPVTVVVNPDAGSVDDPTIGLRVMYQSDVIDESRLSAWLDTYTRILESIAADPDAPVAQCDPLSAEDRQRVLRDFNRTERPIPDVTVYDLLIQQAAESASRPAVRSGEKTLSYDELVRAANRLGRLLLARGAGPEQRVALLLPRSEAMVVALFAVFAAHSAYVPIDAEHPADRIDHMIDAAAPAVILTDSSLADRLPEHLRDDSRTIRLDEIGDELDSLSAEALTDADRGGRTSLDQLAYVIFTSGSTGRPKGVAVGYRGLTNMYYNHAEAIFTPVLRSQGGRRIKIAHTTSFSFDASWEQLLWLLAGHEVHVIDSDMRRDPPRLLAYFDEHRIDAFDVTPTYGDLLVDSGLLERPRCSRVEADQDDTGLVFISLGGEAVGDGLWSALRDTPGVSGYNLYGPTEYTINALGADVADTAHPSVGRPIWNTRAYVLDSTLFPVAPDGVGELYLAGAGLARGYVGMADRTSERFVACPFDGEGERMYRTGDLVRWRADGTLDYLGRADDQVKIRGHRIEPAEISNVLATQAGVARCAVVTVPTTSGRELAAYFVPDHSQQVTGEYVAELRSALRARLPSYMVPAAITEVSDLPLTVNGKLDVRRLPEPQWATGGGENAAPHGPLEQAIADIIADMLDVEQVGRDDDFFQIGGHSLLAVRLASRIGAVVGRSLSIRQIYQNPTPAGLAEASVDAEDAGSMLAPVLTLRDAGAPPVVCFQPAGGLAWSYMGLVRFLTGHESVYALQDPYLADSTTELETFEALVDDQYRRLRDAVPEGPYHLLGWSFGGQIAYEVAARLRRDGLDVGSLILLDSFIVPGEASEPDPAVNSAFAEYVRGDSLLSTFDEAVQDRLISTHRRHLRLTASPTDTPYDGDALLISATEGLDPDLDRSRVAMWSERVGGDLTVERFDLPHIALGQARGWNAVGAVVAHYIARDR